ncbi:hypothetical protein AVEN_53419-1 [Araneus ventricosus]|uniref:Uncharacterized protein n=1 Tax=Araneus ventricosus TaxID=182803 RepID=A0A4Y2AA42_ARAVE|nr:hypothetical protein AVEN_53419-1 [Araneus ventricosus]
MSRHIHQEVAQKHGKSPQSKRPNPPQTTCQCLPPECGKSARQNIVSHFSDAIIFFGLHTQRRVFRTQTSRRTQKKRTVISPDKAWRQMTMRDSAARQQGDPIVHFGRIHLTDYLSRNPIGGCSETNSMANINQ